MAPDDSAFMRTALVNIQSSLHDLAVKVSAMDQRDETLTVKIDGVSKVLTDHMRDEESSIKEIFKLIRTGLGSLAVGAVGVSGWLLIHHDDIAFLRTSADQQLPVRMVIAEDKIKAHGHDVTVLWDAEQDAHGWKMKRRSE